VGVLEDILGSLRLTGGVIVDGQMTGDFAFNAQFTPEECAPFFPPPETLIGYHFIRSGTAVIQVEGLEPVSLATGDIAILPRNDPHVIARRADIVPAEAGQIRWITEEGVHRLSTGTDGPATKMWCGFLGTTKKASHPILNALPPLLTLETRKRRGEWLESSLRFLAEEQPSPDLVSKLAELFLAQAIRDYADQLPANSKGWLKGLADPAVSRALAAIHARYAEDLTVEELAREAGVSRTVLGERFVELLGEPPMRYCARWRMRVAANMLRDGQHNTANVGYAVGFNSEAAFIRAFKREYGEPPATWRRRTEEQEQAAQNPGPIAIPPQTVQYCTAEDGTRLAWSAVGDGPPLVKTANWLNHLEFDFESPIWRGWIGHLARDFQLVRYDERGNGLSDWEAALSLDAFVDDLAAVVDAAGLGQFDLLGISQGAAVSILFSLKYPERVRRIVLLGGYAAGWRARGDNEEVSRREAMLTLTELGWGKDNSAYRQLFTSFYVPGASQEQMSWFNELQLRSTSPEIAGRLMRVLSTIDVRALLQSVRHPTLVLHAKGDQAVPFVSGEELASGIPGARFVPLESNNHILLEDEPGFRRFIDETRAFLGTEPQVERPQLIQTPV
jgi:pimeloyl-ACP methyl ester carboxylesterase/AraC-like DNA-binding protein